MCPRGRGLGGSSAINFSCWLIGDKEDFNEWAELVDDPCWKWEGDAGVKERFRKIENVHNDLTDEQARHISREALDEHSKQGMVDVSYPQIWRQLDFLAMEAGREFEVSYCALFIELETDRRSNPKSIETLLLVIHWDSGLVHQPTTTETEPPRLRHIYRFLRQI